MTDFQLVESDAGMVARDALVRARCAVYAIEELAKRMEDFDVNNAATLLDLPTDAANRHLDLVEKFVENSCLAASIDMIQTRTECLVLIAESGLPEDIKSELRKKFAARKWYLVDDVHGAIALGRQRIAV